ncbi:WLM domain containing protein [Pyrenophora teres f. maculata]|nr:WLM domain containing protein [Pyrenophora teres f. maculata]
MSRPFFTSIIENHNHTAYDLDILPPQVGLDGGAFDSYGTLVGMPNEKKALELLRRAAFICMPIMRHHGWELPALYELCACSNCWGITHFLDHQPINSRGRPIQSRKHAFFLLRVRSVRDPYVFLSMDNIVQTLLHEMAHLEFRWHFDGFYRVNAQLHDELLHEVSSGFLQGKVEQHEIPQQFHRHGEIFQAMRREIQDVFGKRIPSAVE